MKKKGRLAEIESVQKRIWIKITIWASFLKPSNDSLKPFEAK